MAQDAADGAQSGHTADENEGTPSAGGDTQPGAAVPLDKDDAEARRQVAEQPTVTAPTGNPATPPGGSPPPRGGSAAGGAGGAVGPPPVPPAPGAVGAGSAYGGYPYAGSGTYQGSPYGGAVGAPAYGYQPTVTPYGQPGGYPAGGYGWVPPQPQSLSGLAVASLVVSIVGLVLTLTLVGSFVGIVLSPLAIVFAAVGRKAINRGERGGRSQATAGLVIGIVGTVFAAVLVTLMIIGIAADDGDSGSDWDGDSLDARPSVTLVAHG